MTYRNYTLLTWVFMVLFFPSVIRAGSPPCDSRPFFFGVALDGYPVTAERLDRVSHEIGVSPQLIVFFLQWPSVDRLTSAPFPKESLDAIWHSGAIPCLTWEPMVYSGGREVMIPWETIMDGTYDGFLKTFAREAAAWNRPFMIRFAHEMNIDRYHWGTEPSAYGPESPRIYRRLFRYVVSLFREAGAANVRWVFCPNWESVPNASYDKSASWNRMEAYYPGGEYVDIFGMDGYNWGTTQTKAIHGWESRWNEFSSMFRSPWDTLRRLAPDKPVFVFETASVSQGGDKNLWIKKAFETARAWGLTGIAWFHVKKEQDWRLTGSKGISNGGLSAPPACSPHQWIRGVTK